MAKSSKRGHDSYEADDFVVDDNQDLPANKKTKKSEDDASANKFFEVGHLSTYLVT